MKAFEELRALVSQDPERDSDAVMQWEKKWGINAPRVRMLAEGIVKNVRRRRACECRLQVFTSGAAPETWHQQLATLNQLPVTVRVVDDGFADGMMDVPSEQNPGVSTRIEASRERLLQQRHILAPIAADPVHESWPEFEARARNH